MLSKSKSYQSRGDFSVISSSIQRTSPKGILLNETSYIIPLYFIAYIYNLGKWRSGLASKLNRRGRDIESHKCDDKDVI